ncbi:hypothetical protein CCACVL1_19863, partial [Corchorus capsularis]
MAAGHNRDRYYILAASMDYILRRK